MIQERSEKYSKEIDDVMLLVVNIIKKAKAGVAVGEIIGGEVQDLMNAIAGADQLGAEFKDMDVALRTILARVGELAAVLVKPMAVPPPVVHPVASA